VEEIENAKIKKLKCSKKEEPEKGNRNAYKCATIGKH
jgi:hypothetical protein